MSKIPPKKKPTNEKRSRRETARSHGAGSEAAEGIHGAGITVKPEHHTALHVRRTGVGARDGAMRAGSEPLHHRHVEHKSGYGGEGGVPRTSSHERQDLGAGDAPDSVVKPLRARRRPTGP